jgi:hypothetical protein
MRRISAASDWVGNPSPLLVHHHHRAHGSVASEILVKNGENKDTDQLENFTLKFCKFTYCRPEIIAGGVDTQQNSQQFLVCLQITQPHLPNRPCLWRVLSFIESIQLSLQTHLRERINRFSGLSSGSQLSISKILTSGITSKSNSQMMQSRYIPSTTRYISPICLLACSCIPFPSPSVPPR